eukprot:2901388-Rhodomonas_salina.2
MVAAGRCAGVTGALLWVLPPKAVEVHRAYCARVGRIPEETCPALTVCHCHGTDRGPHVAVWAGVGGPPEQKASCLHWAQSGPVASYPAVSNPGSQMQSALALEAMCRDVEFAEQLYMIPSPGHHLSTRHSWQSPPVTQ